MSGADRAPRIEDYALLGDGLTSALVSRDGSVDWLCLPRFDSPAAFAALLGDADNGRWRIAPSDATCTTTRRYREGTNLLETDHRTGTGAVRVVDFMPPGGDATHLIRIVIGLAGHVELDLELVMRFDYGRTVPWLRRIDGLTLEAVAGPERLTVRSPVPLENADRRTRCRFAVAAGERRAFSLTRSASWQPPPAPPEAERLLGEAERRWRAFSLRCPDIGPRTEAVRRSLITLRTLVHEPTGGIVAAPTASLPECIGGTRNWDYRYCWLRDASLTLTALLDLGYEAEADAWCRWLMRAVAGDPERMQIMYGLAGERRLDEWTADWLPGFAGSAPVRIGNAAAGQFQLDVYGEVVEVLALVAERGPEDVRADAASLVTLIVTTLEGFWDRPDDGIWEVRGPRRRFVHSAIMVWVAFDRASAMAAADAADRARWRSLAARVHDEVCARGYDESIGAFVQHYGSTTIDASLLQVCLTGFLPPDDPRVIATVRAIEQRLSRGGFLSRYDADASDDGTGGGAEGAFLMCSWWLVDAYVLMGRRDDAEALFERCAGTANDLGLMSEEHDPETGRMLGNFPQAFSHVGLIVSALNLHGDRGPAARRVARRAEASDDEIRRARSGAESGGGS